MNQAKELNYPINKNYSAGSSPIKSNSLFLIAQKAPKVRYMMKQLLIFIFSAIWLKNKEQTALGNCSAESSLSS